jgi:hypothetical protein
MRKFIAAAMLAVTLSVGVSGCGTIQQAWDIATSTKISPAAMVIARESFNSVEIIATRYLRLKKCSATSGPVCRDPAATRIIIPTVRNGIVARNNMVAFMREHPGELGPAGVYDALNLATDGLKKVFTDYRIGVST